jgi:hypothetical protein
MDEFFAYDEMFRTATSSAEMRAHNAATLRYRNGKVAVTDGPHAETKEQLPDSGFPPI